MHLKQLVPPPDGRGRGIPKSYIYRPPGQPEAPCHASPPPEGDLLPPRERVHPVTRGFNNYQKFHQMDQITAFTDICLRGQNAVFVVIMTSPVKKAYFKHEN